MKINADYHTHTVYSHGKGTAEQNVQAAISRGLKRIAITEHAPGHFLFGVRGEKLMRLRREVDELNRRYANDIEVLFGLECNLTGDGICDAPDDVSAADLLLLGFHRAIIPKDAAAWRIYLRCGRNLPVLLADAIIHTLENYPIKIIAHPGEYMKADIPTLAQGAAKMGVLLELNGSHMSMNIDEVMLAAKFGAHFVINSDAHRPSNVGMFGDALETVSRAGIEKLIANSDAYEGRLRF
ncbi:MAG: DNA polymerase/3'-5' exonuclease PolX [Firmicutes bacterium ADurb.Bin182]|nr:MAG: DNA polymerase/3'-5' exonuclease PolX [Firmicutes bacterium ADurb.Bin182]